MLDNNTQEVNAENAETVEKKGVGRPRAVNNEEAREIRRLKSEGATFASLKESTGLSVGTLQKIVSGTGPYENTL